MINKEKGGKKKMDMINKEVYRDFCPFCSKEIISLNEKQLKYNLEAHKLSCGENPSNKENVKN
jgi:hypothetical protein